MYIITYVNYGEIINSYILTLISCVKTWLYTLKVE